MVLEAEAGLYEPQTFVQCSCGTVHSVVFVLDALFIDAQHTVQLARLIPRKLEELNIKWVTPAAFQRLVDAIFFPACRPSITSS